MYKNSNFYLLNQIIFYQNLFKEYETTNRLRFKHDKFSR